MVILIHTLICLFIISNLIYLLRSNIRRDWLIKNSLAVIIIYIVLSQYTFFNFIYDGTEHFIIDFNFFKDLTFNSCNSYLQLICSVIILLFFIFLYSTSSKNLDIVEVILFILFYYSITYLCFANSILSFMIFFEASSMLFYILISLNENSLGTSNIKYLIYGILCSSLMLFGFGLLWCITGLTDFSDINAYMQNICSENQSDYYLILVSILMITVNIIFKLGLSPLHFWVYPVYSTVKNHVVFFFAACVKPIILMIYINKIYVLMSVYSEFCIIFLFIGFLSLLYGTFYAINSKKLNELIAYSGIANIGFGVTPLAIFSFDSSILSIIFVLGYTFLIYQFLFVLDSFVGNRIDTEVVKNIKDLRYRCPNFGAWYNKPETYGILSLFSLMGLPPTIGFIIKFEVLFFLFSNGYFITTLLFFFFLTLSVVYYGLMIKPIAINTLKLLLNGKFLVRVKLLLKPRLRLFYLFTIFNITFILYFDFLFVFLSNILH